MSFFYFSSGVYVTQCRIRLELRFFVREDISRSHCSCLIIATMSSKINELNPVCAY